MNLNKVKWTKNTSHMLHNYTGPADQINGYLPLYNV